MHHADRARGRVALIPAATITPDLRIPQPIAHHPTPTTSSAPPALSRYFRSTLTSMTKIMFRSGESGGTWFQLSGMLS